MDEGCLRLGLGQVCEYDDRWPIFLTWRVFIGCMHVYTYTSIVHILVDPLQYHKLIVVRVEEIMGRSLASVRFDSSPRMNRTICKTRKLRPRRDRRRVWLCRILGYRERRRDMYSFRVDTRAERIVCLACNCCRLAASPNTYCRGNTRARYSLCQWYSFWR